MLRWMGSWSARSGYPAVRTTFVLERDDSARDAKRHVEAALGSKVNATRHSQIMSEYLLSVALLEQYAIGLDMDAPFLARIEAMREDLAELTVDLSRTQQQRTAGHALVDSLRYLLESQKGYVESVVPEGCRGTTDERPEPEPAPGMAGRPRPPRGAPGTLRR